MDDVQEKINAIEGLNIEALEDSRDSSYRARLILAASRTPFWNEVLIPELDSSIATFDALLTTEVDPWRRYALVEAYSAMSNFKLNLIDALEFARQSEE